MSLTRKLCNAAMYGIGHEGCIETLLFRNANVNMGVNKVTPLHNAAQRGFTESVRILLKAKANVHAVNMMNVTPLHLAAKNSHLRVVKLLLQEGADPNTVTNRGKTALHMHVAVGGYNIRSMAIIRELLKGKADVCAREGGTGNTALHSAMGKYRPGPGKPMYSYLLEAKADVNAANNKQETPLHLAATRGSWEEVAGLLEAKADVTRLTQFDETALVRALRRGPLRSVELLAQVNPNVLNSDHQTALWSHVFYPQHTSCNVLPSPIAVLIKLGVDVTLKDKYGTTLAQALLTCHALTEQDPNVCRSKMQLLLNSDRPVLGG